MKIFLSGLLVLVAACGEGRAIFNIDAYSFMQGTGKDTIPYAIPSLSSGSASTTQKINLPPGFGSSGVDSVRITTGNANLINTAGTGTIGFQLFFAGDSAGTFTADTALNINPTTVGPGADTAAVIITGDLSSVVDSLFSQETLWMRVQASGSNAGATPVTGKAVLTALQIRVVLKDKVF